MTNTARCTNSVAIPTATIAADPGAPPVWVQVAQEIDARGYGGGPFKFTLQTFQQLLANFRRHPAYAGGASDVVAWDFHHASELDPALVATSGAPAQGWVRDLEIRPGANGKAQLWALTRWLEPARTYVKNGQYKWASVVVLFDARDPVTNANIGAVLTSVALTNQPFVEGMAELVAASRQQPSRVAATRVVRVGLPAGVSRNTPQAKAFLGAIAKQLSTPRPAAADVEDSDETPATSEEQALLNQTRQRLRAKHRADVPAILDAAACAGRNGVERAIHAMRQHNPNFAQLSWEEQCSRASAAIRLGAVRV